MLFRLAWRRFEVGVTLVVTLLALVLVLTSAGKYLDRRVYLSSHFRAVAALGFGPKVHPALRIVMVDDRSQSFLGHQPTFAEWNQIAAVLESIGFERIIYAGFSQLDDEIGKPEDRAGRQSFFAAGTTAYLKSANASFVPLGAKAPFGDKGLTVPEGRTAPFPEVKMVLGARPEVRSHVDALGHLNFGTEETVHMAYRFGDAVLPYVGLHATSGLKVSAGGLADALGPLPRPQENELYVDFPKPADLLARAVPANVFFTKLTKRVSPELGKNARKSLEGGKVAFLVPASTGNQFVTTPFGPLPASLVPVAVASSALNRHLLYAPLPHKPLVLLAALGALLSMTLLPLRRALIAGGVLAVATLAVPTGLLLAKGWVFPAFGMTTCVVGATATRLVYFFFATLTEKTLASRDLEMGRTIQALLLPSVKEGRLGEWSYRIVFEPYGPMSGDWFQSYHVKDPAQSLRGVLAIGDVIGKGPSAALNTATITSVWKRFEPTFETSPEDLTPLLSELARVIEDSYRGEQTTSIQLAALYHDRIRIISCAAPQWVKVPAVGAASRIRNRPVNPLGMKVDRARYQFVECEVASGDVFIAHTDGVMEGTDCFVRFSSSLKAKAGEGRRLEFQEFVDAARASGKGAVLPDDFTMIMIRRDGQGVEHALSDQKVG